MAARYCTDSFVFTPVIAAPSGLAVAAVASGGTFPANTYFWKITGSNAVGETTGSNEVTVAIVLNGSANLTWSALPAGTTTTKVYRGLAANAETLIVTLGAVTAYTDTGTAGTAATVPTANSAALPAQLTHAGALRDSAHAAVVANPGAFSTVPPVAGQGHVNPALFQYLAVHASGPEVS